ncbi:hypothetical protein [Celeribacter indicus]|uniref:hypothetical protein n=1 Tax=Celeribacter indicus TaxID=1208324 RepID=UPI001114C99E|nr:hypothetical protein [Celeribacter indicus]
MSHRALGLSQCITQLKECDVRVLRGRLLEECPARRQLALRRWTFLRRRIGAALRSDLSRPPARPWRATTANATPPHARLTRLQQISETAPVAQMAKVLT